MGQAQIQVSTDPPSPRPCGESKRFWISWTVKHFIRKPRIVQEKNWNYGHPKYSAEIKQERTRCMQCSSNRNENLRIHVKNKITRCHLSLGDKLSTLSNIMLYWTLIHYN